LADEAQFWHARYCQQVTWTTGARRYIFDQLAIPKVSRLLEVGCGSGALLESLISDGYGNSYGLDIDLKALNLAHLSVPLVHGDGYLLPFLDRSFDGCLCHFYLLWLKHPEISLSEMVRVTRTGGWVIALGEPDYGGRIDFPPELEIPGKLQTESLMHQGADPLIGRRLRRLLREAGLAQVQSGIISAEWKQQDDEANDELEWQVLEKDLQGMASQSEMEGWRAIDLKARREGSRVLFVPIFYAYGSKP